MFWLARKRIDRRGREPTCVNPKLKRCLWLVLLVSLLFDSAYLGMAYTSRDRPEAGLESGLFFEPDPASPRLVLEEEVFDFGSVEQGQRVEHVFEFRNDGKRELEIGKLRTSCGCTASVVSQTRIPAGGEGSLLVKFNSGARRGPFENSVEIQSNDPFTRNIARIRGTVQPLYWCEPEAVDFGNAPPGSEVERAVLVKALRPDLPLKVGRVWSANQALSFGDPQPADGGYLFVVTARPTERDTLQSVIYLTTGNLEIPQIWARTTGIVDDPGRDSGSETAPLTR